MTRTPSDIHGAGRGLSAAPLSALVLIAAAATICLAATAASGAEDYRFERLWPALRQPWYFFLPNDVASDREGFVYVADTMSHRIKKFTADGAFVAEWGAAEGLAYPAAVTVDDDGAIYVAGIGGRRVWIYDADGRLTADWLLDEGRLPSGMAADNRGGLYIAEKEANRICRFATDGRFDLEWGGDGDSPGAFSGPMDVAVDGDGFVYVTDQGNHRVQKFRADGAFVAQWGGEGDAEGRFRQPFGIDWRDGRLYVVDMLNDRVQVFDADGRFIAAWGSEGSGDGQFYAPSGVVAAPGGYIYVADRNQRRIQKFSPDGVFLANWQSRGDAPGQFEQPKGINVGPDGRIHVADANNHRVQVFDGAGEYIGGWGAEGGEPGRFQNPHGVAVGPDGRVYVADTLNDRVGRFAPDGALEATLTGTEEGGAPFDDPAGIAVDEAGFLYVADWENSLIRKFDPDGAPAGQWGGAGLGQGALNRPMDVAVDGHLVYVADTDNHRIQVFDTDGVFIAAWGENGPAPGQFAAPRGVGVDGNGNLYVADSWNHRVQKLGPDGSVLAVFGEFGSNPGQLRHPADVAVDADGRVYVTDMENNRVQVFRLRRTLRVEKVILVAGGGPYPGNQLWDATRMCANFAYRALTHQGFSKSRIRYFSADVRADLDNNGAADDVAGPPERAALADAITGWASDADALVVYLVDHGGDGIFRLGETETLSAPELDGWLDAFQSAGADLTLILDACESGSFLPFLIPPDGARRVVVASTGAAESAYFITQGVLSFSSAFWTSIFMGETVWEAFDGATRTLSGATEFQHPVLDDTGDGFFGAADGALARSRHIGGGTAIAGTVPVIGAVSPEQSLTDRPSARLWAEGLTGGAGIARVWAVIRPPGYRPGPPGSTVRGLPMVDLMPEAGGGRYAALYERFHKPGEYTVAIHAMDRFGNAAAPALTRVRVGHNAVRRAVILGAGAGAMAADSAVGEGDAELNRRLRLALEALDFQGYPPEAVRLITADPSFPEAAGAPTPAFLADTFQEWADEATADLVIYLTGDMDRGAYRLDSDAFLTPGRLSQWLDDFQATSGAPVALICDGQGAKSFISRMTPAGGHPRIALAGGGSNSGVTGFATFFWGGVINGMDLYAAWVHARNAAWSAGNAMAGEAGIDDNGNAVPDEPSDGLLARRFVVGEGIRLTASPPVIAVPPADRELTGESTAAIRIGAITATGGVGRVWAVIAPPESESFSADGAPEIRRLELAATADGYAAEWDGFGRYGDYRVAIHAMDGAGDVSSPAPLTIRQRMGPDPFEPDDTAAAARPAIAGGGGDAPAFASLTVQRRNFHRSLDADWVRFPALAGQIYEIRTEFPEARCDTVISLYNAKDGPPIATCNDWRDGADGRGETLSWRCPAAGVYYVRITPAAADGHGPETGYDLRIIIPVQAETGLLIGRIADRDGAPVADAQLTLNADGAAALSDPDGRYRMIAPAGAHSLVVSADGFADGAVADVLIVAGNRTTLDVALATPDPPTDGPDDPDDPDDPDGTDDPDAPDGESTRTDDDFCFISGAGGGAWRR